MEFGQAQVLVRRTLHHRRRITQGVDPRREIALGLAGIFTASLSATSRSAQRGSSEVSVLANFIILYFEFIIAK
jgi:hypothetical protein